MNAGKRGAFIVFEGCDRSGKSTQSRHLVQLLKEKGIPVKHMNFPVRESNIGQVINSYLANKQDFPDEVIHLMFSANRWEYVKEMKKQLLNGTTLVVDRYSYSGVAYTVAKGLDFDWCYAPERGLVRPDAVFYLKASANVLPERGNFGNERYEKCDFQRRVGEVFDRICAMESSYWHTIDAAQTEADVQKQVNVKIDELFEKIKCLPLATLT